ncbi:Nif3-like dinuclear metal center hexameric protein [Phenylobacterium deserti]|uniref:NGG1p interacting factor NIF3 n=1 Tax=Phenylobacterium deserti TaxID=1914756 RepID=A0A328ACT3_9CAUL|nr:Nif3-like dinuclear metal center hexameric protein [Phenylobacterium deserti]RAK52405.1 hypothetical protein DJ018_14865 [Phenylobacterium deserti]
MTPRELVARIMARAEAEGAPAPAQPSRRDTFKVGDPDVQITGVVTTGMSTLDVLRRTVAAGANMVITHEATFFRDDDIPDFLEGDPIYAAKVAFAREHGVVIWRDHDLTHRMRPDQMFEGQLKLLGWTADAAPPEQRMPVVTLPKPMSLERIVRHVVEKTGVTSYRVAGDPKMQVRRVAVGVGYAMPSFQVAPDIDVIVGGEAAEGSDSQLPTYDLAAFAVDSTALGQPRGLVLLGHMGTEDIGMQVVADWIRSFAPEIPVQYLPAGEPFGAPL